MKIRVLGCSGSEALDRRSPAYLLDETLLLDAGTTAAALGIAEQRMIRHILLTHSHLDHIKGIPILADNIITSGNGSSFSVSGTAETLSVLRQHVMNGLVWPDFGIIPSVAEPLIQYHELVPAESISLNGYDVMPLSVPHAVPAVAYRISSHDGVLLYTGDMGPSFPGFWETVGHVDALIIEVSFPDSLEDLAIHTGHLTPRLLAAEISKMDRIPGLIGVVHVKPYYEEVIGEEIACLGMGQIRLLRDGEVFSV